MVKYIFLRNKFLIVFVISLISRNIQAEDLSDIYEMALQNDPILKATEASYRAGKESGSQGLAGLLPTLQVTGSTTWNEYRLEDVKLDEYNSNGYVGSINQPLFRLDKWFQFKKGKALSKQAEATFAFQQQESMIRIATNYFNVLNAIDSLNASKAQEKAIGRQRDLAKKRFDVGLAAITELHETQAAYDLSVVSKIAREAQLDYAKESLSAIIGGPLPLLAPLSPEFQIDLPNPLVREEWVKIGLQNNYQLKAAKLNRDAAKNTARSKGSAHLPNIDIVGRVSKNTSDQGKFGGFIPNPQSGLESDNRNYAIQVTLPIFSGGGISSARRQAYALYDKSKEDALYTERSTIKEIRSNHFNVQTQVANVKARKQALTSSKSALEATQTGYEVGTRNIVDLLEAQKRLYDSETDYASSRYEYIISMLRLKASVGSLSPNDLQKISTQMK
jgi:outer membrane protein